MKDAKKQQKSDLKQDKNQNIKKGFAIKLTNDKLDMIMKHICQIEWFAFHDFFRFHREADCKHLNKSFPEFLKPGFLKNLISRIIRFLKIYVQLFMEAHLHTVIFPDC